MRDNWDVFLQDGVKPEDDWCSVVFIRLFPNGTLRKDGNYSARPIGCVAVIEPSRDNAYYKLAAGHKHGSESPLGTALREVRGETGLVVEPAYLWYEGALWRPGRGDRKGHWSCLFVADIEEKEVAWMNSNDPENEGEVPKYFSAADFRALLRSGGFLPLHQQWLDKADLFHA